MGQRPRVICELLDQKSTELLDKDVGCEFVLSTDLTSRQSAQVSHNSNLSAVFEDFFDPEGSELSLKSAVFYCFGMGIATRWLVTQQIAAAMDEVAIGYRLPTAHVSSTRPRMLRSHTIEVTVSF